MCRDLAQADELVICNRFGEDIEQIVSLAKQIDDTGRLHSIGLDPFGIGSVIDALADEGISGDNKVLGIAQGWKLSDCRTQASRRNTAPWWPIPHVLVRGQRQGRTQGQSNRHHQTSLGFGEDRSVDDDVRAVALMSANPRSAPSYQMVIL